MEIIISPRAKKNIAKINPKDTKKVQRKIETLLTDPFAGKPLEGEFSGFRSLRTWPLRIIYKFDNHAQIISIINIDYRGNVYK